MSTRLGVKGIDVGCSMMAMHSIKEFAGVTDFWHY
jgi:aspartyl aminopeptidase